MKQKILNILVDVVLIMLVFMLTDYVMLQVLHAEKLLLEVLVYVVFYGLVFGAKWLVCRLFAKCRKTDNGQT